MERGRHRKSKSSSGIEGIQQIQRQKFVSRLSSDSRSYIDGSTREDMFVLDLGKSPLRRPTATSMKKLLAEEMSKEVESKKRPPSIIARLMGFEGSASPKHVNRQQKRPSGSYQQQNVSAETQRCRKLYDSLSNRSRSSADHQDFKDVYEDLEASHLVNRRSSRWSASSMLTKAEMAIVQQKFIDAKLLSTNKKLQDSKELDDALEMLYSNQELLMRFLEEPKNLHDHSCSGSLGSHIAVLRPNSIKDKSNSTSQNLQQNTYLKRKDSLLLEPQNRSGTYISRKTSNIQLEEKDGEKILPTRIVILKPNKMQNVRISGLSPDHVHEMGSFRVKDSSCNVGVSRPMSMEAREIARSKENCKNDDETYDTKSTTLGGYAGDESSYEDNESDSDYESEKLKLFHKKSFNDFKSRKYPSPRIGDSSVNSEGKQRLSERWKMTQRYQDLEMVSKGSTLGEMLSLPGKKMRPKKLDGKTSGDNGREIGYGPYGISSRDGWKDETSKTSSGLRSVPSSIHGKSHKKSTHHDMSIEDKHLMCSEHIHSGRSKLVNGKPSHSSEDSKSRSKKPHPYQHLFTNEKHDISEANFEIEMEANIKDLPEQRPIFQIPEEDYNRGSPDFDVKIIAEHGSEILSSKSHEKLLEELSLVANEDKADSHELGNSSLQELDEGLSEEASPFRSGVGGELPNSSIKSKGANRTSPVSVLEVPFAEDASSSSESFERLGAELHELRMQLQLLKMESGTYTEASSSFVPTEEQTLSGVNQYHFLAGQGWEISYALDILQESGLEDSIFDILKSKWHSPDCPLDVKLFDDLENKYNDETTSLGSERKLLFDRTNLAISEILQENADFFPWVKPKLARFSSTRPNEGVGVVLEKLMRHDDPNAVLSGEGLDRDMQWPDCKGEVEALGNEIEKMLVDEMIVEVLCN